MSQYYTLNSGNKIPSIGFGVYLMPPQETFDICYKALKAGYRHIDSAQFYQNEQEVCDAIAQWIKDDPVNNKRESIFYTTKVMDPLHGYEPSKKGISESLEKAKSIDYIDLFLIHSPQSNYEKRHGTWKALEEAVESGKVKNIGVSNYGIPHLEELLAYKDLKITPAVNQIEMHPWLQRKELADYCQDKGILIEAYSPLSRGQGNKLEDPVLVGISKKLSLPIAQVLLSWSLSKGYLPLPKTATESRLAPNLESQNIKLPQEDIASLDSLDEGYVSIPMWDPVTYPLDK